MDTRVIKCAVAGYELLSDSKPMKIPPEIQFHACMEVMLQAILQARNWGWEGNVPAEQLADLMDAVHNIPAAVQHWDANGDAYVIRELEAYERKWGRSGGPCLRSRYEQLLDTHADDME